MIELMLQLFGGGGGKSGGGGGAGGSSGAGSHSSGKGSAGGTKKDSGGAPAKSFKSIDRGEAVTSINEKESYALYDKDGKLKGTQSGKDLLQRIQKQGFRYDKSRKRWVARSGNTYTIYKRK